MDDLVNCVFCGIVTGELEASVVAENERALAFMNRAQVHDGHVLVIPKAHRRDVREFEPSLNAAVMELVSEVSRAVTAAFAPDGITVRHNIGEAGGQDVFHAHVHVQPRREGDGLHRPYPESPPHPPRVELDAMASRIRGQMMEVAKGDPRMSEERLVVTPEAGIDETQSRGDLRVRRIFDSSTFPFESSFQFVLRNRLPAGGANERHIHDDVEKVYYFLDGRGEVSCGPWTKRVGPGDFLFFPAAIEHEIHADADSDLEFIVCAARTLGAPRGLETED